MLILYKVPVLLFLIVTVVFCACNDTQPAESTRKNGYSVVLKTPEDSLYQEVMHDHDLAMARMGKVSKYIKLSQQRIDSISKLSAPAQRKLSLYKNSLDSLNRSLRKAHENMYTWMEEFSLDSAIETNANRRAYLLSEKPKVERVKNDILSLLTKADSLFTGSKEKD